MCPAGSPSSDRHELLVGFLTGENRSRRRFYSELKPLMMGLARKIGADLPKDLHEEIVQQAMLGLLLAEPRRYDPAKGSPESFVGMVVWDAARRVRADYAAPGQKTRRENVRAKAGASVTATPPAAADPLAPPPPPPIVPLDDVLETMETGMEGFRDVEQRLDAEKVLRRADSVVAAALHLIHWEGEAVGMAAAYLSLPRTTLNGRLTAFAREFRFAA